MTDPTRIVASGAASLPVWIDGDGPPIVLAHAGVADHRMWDPLTALLAPRHRVIRYDMRGFGSAVPPDEEFSAADDLAAVFDALALDEAAVLGSSQGGRVALQFAIEHPERVSALTLVPPAMPGHDWSEELRAAWDEEEKAFDAGDLDAAAECNVRTWLAGPRRRPEDLDPALRDLALDMARMVLAHDLAGAGEERDPDPPLGERLDRVRAPTLVVDLALDYPDFTAIADRVAAGIPGARRATLDGVAHLAALERPEDVARLLG